MGLDMFLYKGEKVEGYSNPFEYLETKKVNEVCYWRKSNQIHKWFVTYVQDDNDKCDPYFVTKEKLIQLFDICNKVLNNFLLAPELLPTEKGFFFGGTEYNMSYMEDIKDTYLLIKEIIKETNFEKEVVIYRSSW